MLSIEPGAAMWWSYLLVAVTLLSFVIKPYPNDVLITVTGSTGPIYSGISMLYIVEYVSAAATVRATPLNAYDMYVKTLVLSIFENAERTNTNVSTSIIPMAKKTARLIAIWTPSVADATADIVNADI